MRLALNVIALSIVLAGLTAKAAETRLNLNHTGPEATVELSGDAGTEYLIEGAIGSAEYWRPITSFILTEPSRLWRDTAAGNGNRFFSRAQRVAR